MFEIIGRLYRAQGRGGSGLRQRDRSRRVASHIERRSAKMTGLRPPPLPLAQAPR
jgi:hypothetical protein